MNMPNMNVKKVSFLDETNKLLKEINQYGAAVSLFLYSDSSGHIAINEGDEETHSVSFFGATPVKIMDALRSLSLKAKPVVEEVTL